MHMYYLLLLLYSCENMFVFFLDVIVLFVLFLYTSGAFDPMIATDSSVYNRNSSLRKSLVLDMSLIKSSSMGALWHYFKA